MRVSASGASALLTLVLTAIDASAQTTAAPGGAILNCDTAVLITAVDGDASRKVQNHGWGRENCAIPLPAGPHVIDVCYDVYNLLDDYKIPIPPKCTEVKRVELDAESGHVYRVKLVLDDPWRGWIVDVTSIEAGLPDRGPQVNKGRKRDVPKAERKSIVLLKIKPLNSTVFVDRGGSDDVWFYEDIGFITRPLFKTKDPQGFSLIELSIGDTFALNSMMYPDKQEFGGYGGAGPCDDSYFPVFEDLPGGKVLYLGHFDVEINAPRPILNFDQRDLKEARAWLEKARPGLGAKLEVMPFRWGRTRWLCNIGRMDGHFVNAAGQP